MRLTIESEWCPSKFIAALVELDESQVERIELVAVEDAIVILVEQGEENVDHLLRQARVEQIILGDVTLALRIHIGKVRPRRDLEIKITPI